MRSLLAVWDRPAAPGARPPGRADWFLVGALAVAAVVEGALRGDVLWPAATTAVTLAALAVLPWRRTHPLAAVLASVVVGSALELAQVAARQAPTTLLTAGALILLPYALFRWGSGRAAVIGSLALAAGVAVSVVAGGGAVEDAVGGAVVLLLAMVLGESRRQRVAARERIRSEARLRERERLARDLHDTVAHHVSAIAVRAQAGQVSADPRAAADALRVIEEEARRTLAEMRSLVHVLRDQPNDDDRAGDRALAPGAGIAGLDALALLADVGPPAVRVHVADDVRPLAPTTATAVFRLAQEAVTNARRHARGATAVDVSVERTHGAVLLRVHDDGSPAPQPGAGYGVPGMIERATLLGGSCTAGRDPAGGWTVSASLPAAAPGVRERVAP